jgi:FMN phosphatase YigB (HAD superfamily)
VLPTARCSRTGSSCSPNASTSRSRRTIEPTSRTRSRRGRPSPRFGILSNTDPDYLDASFELIGVEPDLKIAASEIGSYKPAREHWDVFFERTGADRSRHVHVAASLFHDIAPAADLGLTTVWINRQLETSDLPRAAELTDLAKLPETLDDLVPA